MVYLPERAGVPSAVVRISGAIQSWQRHIKLSKESRFKVYLREIIHMPKVRIMHTKLLLNLGVNGETRWKTLQFSSPAL